MLKTHTTLLKVLDEKLNIRCQECDIYEGVFHITEGEQTLTLSITHKVWTQLKHFIDSAFEDADRAEMEAVEKDGEDYVNEEIRGMKDE